MNLSGYVEQLAETATKLYVDGTPFFDYLDDHLGDDLFLKMLSRDVIDEYGYMPALVTTGKFGEKYRKFLTAQLGELWVIDNLVVMPGDLRHIDIPVGSPRPRKGKDYLFLDNSIYKGRTLTKTLDWFLRHGAVISDCWVLYDGTLPPHDIIVLGPVKYYYRWHKDGIRVAEARKAV